jgi:hypothetical protein
MTTQYEQPLAGPEPTGEPLGSLPAIEAARRLDRLAPLLHELIAWDLVRQTEDGNFELPEDVQERLRALTGLRSGSIAQVYVGRKCGRCGSIRVTRLVDGVRLCSTCRAEAAAPPPPEEPATPDLPPHRSRWHRKAG